MKTCFLDKSLPEVTRIAFKPLHSILVVLAFSALVLFGANTASASLVIAEAYGGGGNSGSTWKNDFIVLFNRGATEVDVNGWSVQYTTATGPTGTNHWAVTPLATSSKIIPPGGYFLIQQAPGTGGSVDLPTPDAIGTFAMVLGAFKVALCNTTDALSGTCPTGGNIVDFLGAGSANCSETSPASAPSNTASIRRKDGGCLDTGNNSTDFETANPPTPRNSSSPSQSCTPVAPQITSDPQSRTNNAGTTATFTVVASSTGLTYEWKKNNDPISDPNVLGVNSATLTITSVTSLNAGNYHVVVANEIDSVNSQSATLTVIDPAISTQPTSRTNLIGDTANFFVGAGGLELTYQWRKDNIDLPNGTTAALNIADLQSSDAGEYSVVVSNSNGNSVTSSVVNLTIAATPSTRLARWTFNGNFQSATEPASSEAVNTASASLVGSTTGDHFAGSFSDPGQVLEEINRGWQTAGYPAVEIGNKESGVQFNVSTEGYQDVFLAWEQRHSATASKYIRLQYSTDGVNFVDGPVITMMTNSSFEFFSGNLAGISGLNNNPNAAFRIVTEFESTATGSGNESYAGSGNNYGTVGTIRYDIVSVYGNVLGTISPIPLNVTRDGNDLVLTWSNPAFVLQSADEVNGTFTEIPSATSPYTTSLGGARKFFRLKY
ncbi:MAG: immunoglobulin domain-containing protein [Verrucomicrobia bacterium]|nr:immunoglobulin domain-containing protein [Verrucomicrobiota bacterium]